jgi:hypothetical protein
MLVNVLRLLERRKTIPPIVRGIPKRNRGQVAGLTLDGGESRGNRGSIC